METKWKFKSVDTLSENDMFTLLKFRARASVIYGRKIDIDLEGIDKKAVHVIGYQQNNIVGYCRICPPGIEREQPTISRVVIDKPFRGKGLGLQMIHKSIDHINTQWGGDITLITMPHLEKYHVEQGFKVALDGLVDTKEHIEMKLSK